MAAGSYNFTIEQGVTLRKSITWKDSIGNPVNLTGYTAKMQLRDSPGGVDYLELNSSNGDILFTNPTGGAIQLYLSSTVTNSLTQTKYVYDLDLYAPNGDVIRLLKGRIQVSPAITV